MDTGSDNHEPELQSAVERAALEGRHGEAFALTRQRLLARADVLLARENLIFQAPTGNHTLVELLAGLDAALSAEIAERGENGSVSLKSAFHIVRTLLVLQIELEHAAIADTPDGESFWKVLMTAAALGEIEAVSRFAMHGHFEALAENKILKDRQRRAGYNTSSKVGSWRPEGMAYEVVYRRLKPDAPKSASIAWAAVKMSKNPEALRKAIAVKEEEYNKIMGAVDALLTEQQPDALSCDQDLIDAITKAIAEGRKELADSESRPRKR